MAFEFNCFFSVNQRRHTPKLAPTTFGWLGIQCCPRQPSQHGARAQSISTECVFLNNFFFYQLISISFWLCEPNIEFWNISLSSSNRFWLQWQWRVIIFLFCLFIQLVNIWRQYKWFNCYSMSSLITHSKNHIFFSIKEKVTSYETVLIGRTHKTWLAEFEYLKLVLYLN
jgi:hypothetical protein